MSQMPMISQQRQRKGMVVCHDCELSAKCTFNAMPGQGRKGGIMIVGESITQRDARAGKPFTDIDGQKLAFLLNKLNLRPEQVYTTMAVKCDIEKKTQKITKYAAACRPHLLDEIAYVQPKVIVTMGTVPLAALMQEPFTANEYRGFPMQLRMGDFQTWVVPTYSITHAIGKPENDPIIARDLGLAKQIAHEGFTPQPLDVDVRVLTSVEEVKEATSELYHAPEFSFDLETKDFKFQSSPILCSSFSTDGKTSFVIPIDHHFNYRGELRRWTPKERAQVLWYLKQIYKSPASKTAQNGKFDIKFLRRYGIDVTNFDFDTMLAHHLIDASAPHDLLFIAQMLGIVHEKYDHVLEMQKRIHGKTDYSLFEPRFLYHYGGIDAAVTQQARPILQDMLTENGCDWVFQNVSIPQTHLLADMEYIGAKIDIEGMNALIANADTNIAQLLERARRLTRNAEFNPNSTKQLKDLFIHHGVQTSKTTKSGQVSVDEEALKPLTTHPRVGELVKTILDLRALVKLKGTYLDGKDAESKKKTGLKHKIDANGYLHTDFKITGTYTGRLSSKDPNLQNIPKDDGIRQLFIPDEQGDVLMSVDYKQLEVRVVAAISKDPILIREVLEGVDMHSRNAASLLLNVPEADFMAVMETKERNKKDPTYPISPLYGRYSEARRAAKAVTFGVLYGSTAQGVAARNNLALDLCEKFINEFFGKYRVLHSWIKLQHKRVGTTSKVRTITGRFIKFHDLEWAKSRFCPSFMGNRRVGETERISVNMPIQGTGSDVFQSRKIMFNRYLKDNGFQSRVVLSLHDGFIANVKPNEREELAAVTPDIMYTVLNEGTQFEVPLEVDLEWGTRWEGKDE